MWRIHAWSAIPTAMALYRHDGTLDMCSTLGNHPCMSNRRRSFTIRFKEQETHDLLALLASRMHVSMNSLAETMIKNQIGDLALALEDDLSQTLARLAEYRGDPSDDVARFADAEVAHPGRLTARMVAPRQDPHDIAGLFAAATRGAP